MIKTLKGRRTSLLTLVILAVALVITFSYMATASAQGAEPTTVTLISDSVIEIEYATPVTSDEQAKKLFTITYDGAEVEWEYLSYFKFGPYAERGGVVNVKLTEPLEVGEPRIQRREVVLFENTQDELGAAAAAKLQVQIGESEAETATFVPFFEEIQRGHMSQIDAYGSALSGNSDSNTFASDGTFQREYTTDYVTKVVGEGINGMVGRSEYLNLPAIEAGLTIHMVGAEQSVYEDPAYRGEYVYGETEDTYTRTGISGTVENPIIVTTADEVMRHDSEVDADGKTASGNAARVNDDYFQLGEDFLRLYYEFGVVEGSLRFPLGFFSEEDTYRYDLQLAEAYENAKAKGLWAGTEMIESLENYYVYGTLIHFEMIPESADGQWGETRFPINTREELASYDNDLYEVICGVHGRYHWFTGNNSQTATRNDFQNDVLKNSHPWFWQSQVDNYTVDEAGAAIERAPLAIEHVDIISDTQIEIKFNREIETISPAATSDNWKVYIDGQEVAGFTVQGGYAWRTITLQNRNVTLDNGNPYGKDFKGFTAEDIEERCVSNGGWIADDEKPGEYALGYGEMVTLEQAIEEYGAGAVGKVEVEYVGTEPIKDWDGNELTSGTKEEANFNPWMGNVYRSALTGVYIYADSVVEPETMMAAGHLYDSSLSNNTTVTYEQSAGGDDFPEEPMSVAVAPQNGRDIQTITSLVESGYDPDAPVTYDNPGQRIADGSVKLGGGMQLIGGYTYSHHAAMQPSHRNQIQNGFHVWLYVEGWGGTTFQSDETMVLKDAQMTRYKNENLVYHEGGHGIDSFTRSADTYGIDIYNDITAAWLTAVAPENGRTWWNQYDTEGAYLRNRDEFCSTGSTFFHSTMREQFMGINDGTWTPINTREELYRYDPYAFEVFKRIFYNGDLGLYYADETGEVQWGNPEYRVIPEDWEVLKEAYPEEFGDWTCEDDLIAWAATISEVAHNNPYTGEVNNDINWVSWNTPNVWDIGLIENPANPNNTKDFVGQDAYNPVSEGSPTENQAHPFISEGVVKPERPAEIEALVAPVGGTLVGEPALTDHPVLIAFTLEDYAGEVTMNNAPNSFELTIDGQATHFYFWSFEETGDQAVVTLRVEWPVDETADIQLKVVDALVVEEPTVNSIQANPASLEAEGGVSTITLTGAALEDGIQVAAFDGDTVIDEGTTTGTETKQTVELTFPANESETAASYTVKYSLDGGATWTESTATVIVAAKGSVEPSEPADITDVMVETTKMTSSGGELEVILTGTDLVDGIPVVAKLNGNVLAAATSVGDGETQVAILNMPYNNSTTDKEYTILYSPDGGLTWKEITTVTVEAGTDDSKPSTSKPSTDKKDASISPKKASINIAAEVEDIVVTLDDGGRKLQNITNDGNKLKKDTDYTVDGDTITIKASYLSALTEGTVELVFEMNGGEDPVLTLTVAKEEITYTVLQPTRPAGTKVDAVKTKNTLILNGAEMSFPAVNIDGWNWLKLRDVAMLLNGTEKTFSLTYDPTTNIVDITTGGAYTPLGDELQDALANPVTAVASPQQIRLNGETVAVAAYNINGYNYFRLRDIAILLNFGVDFAEETGVITLDLTAAYKE